MVEVGEKVKLALLISAKLFHAVPLYWFVFHTPPPLRVSGQLLTFPFIFGLSFSAAFLFCSVGICVTLLGSAST